MDPRESFRLLHQAPFIMPNPWDPGSAKILASMGFPALATTSAGFANALGRTDGAVTRDEAIAHARSIGHATSLPINADLENGFGDEPRDVAQTIEKALAAGLAGCSFEAGAIRVSTGSAISMAAQSAIVDAAKELQGPGTPTFWTKAIANAALVKEAFSADR